MRIVLGVTSAQSLGLMSGLPERLAVEGWTVHVVSSPGAQLDALTANSNVTTHALPMSRDPRPLNDLKSLIGWWRLLRRLQPQVILVGTPKASFLAMLAGAGARVRLRVYHLRGLRLETTSGISRLVYAAIERLTFATATSTVAVSPSLMDRVVSLGLSPANKLTVLGSGSSNGVDIDRFRPADDGAALREELGLAPVVPIIGYVGRLHPDKGLPTLIEASRRLSKRQVSHQLLIIGASDHPGALTLLDALALLDAQVVVTGPVPDTAPFYHLMDLHCLPTLREGFPNVALEAAASGVPTVTTNATGAVDSVIPGQTGVIVPTRDSLCLAQAVEVLLTDPVERSRQAVNARAHTVDNFSRPIVHTRLVEFLDESLANKV